MASTPKPASRTTKRRNMHARLFIASLVMAAGVLPLLVWGPFLNRLMDYRFQVVSKGKLYRSAEMPPSLLARRCKRLGIRTVIDFRKPADRVNRERTALARVGVRHVHLPSKQVPSPEVVRGFLEVMDDPDNLPALLHCTHGVGRTGVHSAIYRMEYERWSNERARQEAERLGGLKSFREDKPKGRFLLRYAPRWRGSRPARRRGARSASLGARRPDSQSRHPDTGIAIPSGGR